MSRKSRAAAAPHGSIAADARIRIDDHPSTTATITPLPDQDPPRRDAQLAEDEFAHLKVMVCRWSGTSRAEVWRTGDGRWWRRGGFVRIQKSPRTDDVRKFVVFLFKGANEDDVKFLIKTVAAARRGDLRLWTRMEQRNEWVDDLTFTTWGISRPYEDPYTHADHSRRVVICDDPQCREQWHVDYGEHTADDVERDDYRIAVIRPLKGDEPWSVFLDEVMGDVTPECIASFVSDLQWMAAECERANNARLTDATGTA